MEALEKSLFRPFRIFFKFWSLVLLIRDDFYFYSFEDFSFDCQIVVAIHTFITSLLTAEGF
jgi:hypothetical protein